MIVFPNLSAFSATLGNEIGVSSWTEVSQQRIDHFADVTGDHQWIHTDPERARRELGMTTIAHGYLTLSLMAGFLGEVFAVTSVKRMINYGCNKVRFLNPVPAGSRVRGRVMLCKAVLDGGMLRATLGVSVEIEGQEKPALHAEVITLMYE